MCAQVFSAQLIKDPQNPANNRGYGFVKYKTKEGALTALDRLHNKEITGYHGHRVGGRPRCCCRYLMTRVKEGLSHLGLP